MQLLFMTEPPLELMKALKKFGFSRFRLGQETAIMRVLCGEFGVMSSAW